MAWPWHAAIRRDFKYLIISQIDDRLLRIQVPDSISGPPRSLQEYNRWKGYFITTQHILCLTYADTALAPSVCGVQLFPTSQLPPYTQNPGATGLQAQVSPTVLSRMNTLPYLHIHPLPLSCPEFPSPDYVPYAFPQWRNRSTQSSIPCSWESGGELKA
jgi:hypothetical protein